MKVILELGWSKWYWREEAEKQQGVWFELQSWVLIRIFWAWQWREVVGEAAEPQKAAAPSEALHVPSASSSHQTASLPLNKISLRWIKYLIASDTWLREPLYLFFFPGRFKFGFFKSATCKHFQSFWKRQFSLLFCRFTEFLGWQGSSGCAGEPDSRWLGRRPGAPSLQGPAPGQDKAKSERGGYFTASWARRAKKPVYGQKFSLKAEFPDTFF